MKFRTALGCWKWLFERLIVIASRPVYCLLVANKVIFPYYREIKRKRSMVSQFWIDHLSNYVNNFNFVLYKLCKALYNKVSYCCKSCLKNLLFYTFCLRSFYKKTASGIHMLSACPICIVTTLVNDFQGWFRTFTMW